MSARQQFQFPATSPQSPTFAPDPENPLHTSTDKPMTETVSSSMRPSTSGLGAVIGRKRSQPGPAKGPAPMNPLTHPGTADPYSRNRSSNFAKGQFHVAAPTPQAPRSSPLLSRDTNSMHSGFKVPSMREPPSNARDSGENNAHISTLDASPPMKKSDETFSMPDSHSNSSGFVPLANLKFNPVSSNMGPRRVSINKDSGNLNDIDDDSGLHIPPGHEITEDGRVKAINGLKRMHDEVEDDGDVTSYEPPMKRYRNNQHDMTNANLGVHMRDYSPQTAERPSSRLSHSDQHRTSGSVASGDTPHLSGQRQRFSGFPSSPHKSTPSPYQPQPIQRQQEPGALTKLLGQDPDLFVQEHMSEYDEMVQRWSNCTMEEWIAGADEIMSHYNRILDMVSVPSTFKEGLMAQRASQVKERVSAKLRRYEQIHENIDKHNTLLRERSETLDATKKKLVNESGSVLKH